MEKQGLIHIYCGDGKGKTTASLGLILRAWGRGRKILVVRFLKDNHSGELEAFGKMDGVTLIPSDRTFGFIIRKEDYDRKIGEMRPYYTEMFRKAAAEAMTGNYDLMVMDEIIATTRKNVVDVHLVTDFLKNKPAHLEVVMTGREPLPELVELADYVSEVKKIKHPIDRGIKAREGIEY